MLIAEDITFSYVSSPILKSFSHAFLPGVTVVSGRSGCGKSTLLYLLGLMLRPTSGGVVIGGVKVSDHPDSLRSQLRARDIGFVFQDAVLDPSRTVLDNVTEAGLYAGIGRAECQVRARRRLEQFGLRARADHRPGEISGGQAQRVALCRALIKEPRIVLADEPTGNLDAESAEVVWDSLTGVGDSGAVVVIATHDARRLESADHTIRLP